MQAVRTEVQYESPREIANQHIWVHGDNGVGHAAGEVLADQQTREIMFG